jgi:prevent-host-death family protein
MAKNRIVGSRELKTRLGHYLGRVRRGETILVTDRHEPVAELRPIHGAGDERSAALQRLAAAGAITLPERSTMSRIKPIRSRGLSGSSALDADRSEGV